MKQNVIIHDRLKEPPVPAQFKAIKKEVSLNFPGKPIKAIKSWMSCAKVKLTPGSELRVN